SDFIEIQAPITPSITVVQVIQPGCAILTGTITITSPIESDFEYSIDGGISYNSNNIFENLSPNSYIVVVRSNSNCVSESVNILINEPIDSLETPTLAALEYCDPNSDGFGVFDLTQVIPIIEGVNTVDVDITFHETEDDALFNANNIEENNPLTAYPNIDDYNQTIYVRIANDSGCFAVIPLELIVHKLPQITKTILPLEVCEDVVSTGIGEFNLTDALSVI